MLASDWGFSFKNEGWKRKAESSSSEERLQCNEMIEVEIVSHLVSAYSRSFCQRREKRYHINFLGKFHHNVRSHERASDALSGS